MDNQDPLSDFLDVFDQKYATFADSTYEKFTDFIYKNTGIVMKGSKKTLLANRLRKRLKVLNLESYEDYWEYLQKPVNVKNEMYHFLNAVSTNETYFQRGTSHYDILVQEILPNWRSSNKGNLQIWSAGCSTGEEPYDLAMYLLDFQGANPGFRFNIIASDISQQVLTAAEIGEYADRKVSKLTPEQRKKYFTEIKLEESSIPFGTDILRVKPAMKQNIQFRHINLMENAYPKNVDIIFCRNVMIYFDRETQKTIVDKFTQSLNPGGYLFIGHSETLQLIETSLKYVRFNQGTVYQKA